MSEWVRQSKLARTEKHLAHWIAYLDGKHYAVDQKYWRIARKMLENIPDDPGIEE